MARKQNEREKKRKKKIWMIITVIIAFEKGGCIE